MNNIHNMHVHSKPVLRVQMGTIRTFLGVQYTGYYRVAVKPYKMQVLVKI